MRNLLRLGMVVPLALVASACALGGPEDPADPAFAEEQSGLSLEDPALAQEMAVEEPLLEANVQSAAALELAANAGECDTLCTVRQWLDDERYEEAREVLTERLVDAPTDVDSAVMLATVDIADEEYEAAYALSDDTLRHAPDSVRLLEKRALASLLGHDVETAVVDYESLIEHLQSLDLETQRSICDAGSGRCASPLAREALAWMGLATALYNRGELEQSQAIAADMLESDAFKDVLNPAYPWFVLALNHARRGDDAKALEYYEKVLSRHPYEPASLINVGGIHYRSGDLDKSLDYQMAAFEHAGKARRTAAIAWSNVAEIDMLRGDYAAAEEKLQETLAISKRFAAGHFNLAVLYDVTGKTELSMRHMRTALALDMQGVTRWNMSFFNDDWTAHFAALQAEASGQTRKAEALWSQLLGSRVSVLAASARRHLDAADPRQALLLE